MKNVYGKRQHLFWSARDSYSAINGYRGVLYRNNTYPTGNDDKSMRTNVCYQYGTSRTTRYTVNDILKDALKKNGVTKLGILKTITWRYFPRYSPADIQGGILWDTLKIQGKYGMWYAGASVIFESVKSVVEYNKLLVRLMEPIKKTNDEVGADTIDYMAVRVPKINAAYGDDDENYNTGVEDQTDPVVNDYPANNDHDNANNDHDNAELYD